MHPLVTRPAEVLSRGRAISACAWQARRNAADTCVRACRRAVELRRTFVYVHLAEKSSRTEIRPVPRWLSHEVGAIGVYDRAESPRNARSRRVLFIRRSPGHFLSWPGIRTNSDRENCSTRGMLIVRKYAAVHQAQNPPAVTARWKATVLCAALCPAAKSFIYFRPCARQASSSRSVSCEPRDAEEDIFAPRTWSSTAESRTLVADESRRSCRAAVRRGTPGGTNCEIRRRQLVGASRGFAAALITHGPYRSSQLAK